MLWSDIPWRPTDRTLRQFAGLWGVCLAALACWQGLLTEPDPLARTLTGLALTVGPLGLVWPQTVRPLFIGAMLVTFPVGWVVSRLALTTLFYGVFAPVALVLRLIGRDVLCRRRPRQGTYWTARPGGTDVRRYLRQF